MAINKIMLALQAGLSCAENLHLQLVRTGLRRKDAFGVLAVSAEASRAGMTCLPKADVADAATGLPGGISSQYIVHKVCSALAFPATDRPARFFVKLASSFNLALASQGSVLGMAESGRIGVKGWQTQLPSCYLQSSLAMIFRRLKSA